MKVHVARALAFVVALGGLGVLAAPAKADDCSVGCAMHKKECLQVARVAGLACKADCRANSPADEVGTCSRGCMDTFRAAKDTCRSDQVDCRGTCAPPDVPPDVAACLGGCGQDLAACAQGVVAAARTCVSGCAAAADRLACLQGCAADAQAGAATCASDFRACVSGCGGPTPTTTLPPTPMCGPDATGACGGTCLPGLTCQAPPPGSLTPLACVCLPGGS